jgi:ABC-type transporter Mla maintaining outer membrane lipid asymmetry ATPase subunit MlaF
MAERDDKGNVRILPATPEKEREAEFIMIREGMIVFEGDADALRTSKDPYIVNFLD